MSATGGWHRQASWFWQARVLRRPRLLADDLPLGLKLEVPARDDVGRRLFKYGVHEPRVLDWIERLPSPEPGHLALDIGANLGWYTTVLHRLSGGALSLHAFEPDPDNRALLNENLALNGMQDVHVSPLALADASGTATLHRYRDINLGKHSLRPLDGAVGRVDVARARLDDYLREAGIDDRSIWLVKLDVEGLEPAVIRGAAAALPRIRALVMEYSPMYYGPGEGQAMLEALADVGLSPSLHDGEGWAACGTEDIAALSEQRDTVWLREPQRQR